MILEYFNKFIKNNKYLKNFLLSIEYFVLNFIYPFFKNQNYIPKIINKLIDLFYLTKDYFDYFNHFYVLKTLDDNSIYIKRNPITKRSVFLFFKSFYIQYNTIYFTYYSNIVQLNQYLKYNSNNFTNTNFILLDYLNTIEDFYLNLNTIATIFDDNYIFDDNPLLIFDLDIIPNYRRVPLLGFNLKFLASTSSKFDYENVLLKDLYYCFLFDFVNFYFRPKNYDFYFVFQFNQNLQKYNNFYVNYINFYNIDFNVYDYNYGIFVIFDTNINLDNCKILIGRNFFYNQIDYIIDLYNHNLFQLCSNDIDEYNSYILQYLLYSLQNEQFIRLNLKFFISFFATKALNNFNDINLNKLNYNNEFYKDGFTELCIYDIVMNKPLLYIGLPKFFAKYKDYKFLFNFEFKLTNINFIKNNDHYVLNNDHFVDISENYCLFYNNNQLYVKDYVNSLNVFNYNTNQAPLCLEYYSNNFFILFNDKILLYDNSNFVDIFYPFNDNFYFIRNNDKIYFLTESLNLYYFNLNTNNFVFVNHIISNYTKIQNPKMIFVNNNLNIYFADVYFNNIVSTMNEGNLVITISNLNTNPIASSIYKTNLQIEQNIVKNANDLYYFKNHILMKQNNVLFKFVNHYSYYGKYDSNKIYVVQYDNNTIIVSTISL